MRTQVGIVGAGPAGLLGEAGVAGRLQREGMVHHGIELRSGGRRHRVPLTDLTGRSITIYGQQEVVKDLIQARLEAGGGGPGPPPPPGGWVPGPGAGVSPRQSCPPPGRPRLYLQVDPDEPIERW